MSTSERLSPFAELVTSANAACDALRSDDRGNRYRIADALDQAIRRVLADRDSELSELSEQMHELGQMIEALKSALSPIP